MTDTSIPPEDDASAAPDSGTEAAAEDETTEAPRTPPVTEHPAYDQVVRLLGVLNVAPTENAVRNVLDFLDAEEKGSAETAEPSAE